MKYSIFLFIFFFLSCSSYSAEQERASAIEQSIVNGSSSTEEDDETLLLIYHSEKDKINFSCSAVLISPSVFVTARHCVSKLTSDAPCSSSKSYDEKNIESDYDVEDYFVYAGKKYPDNAYRNNMIKIRSIYHGNSLSICNNDIAIGVMNDTFENIKVAKIAVKDPSLDENLEAIGWGLTLQTEKQPVRNKKEDVKLVNMKLGGSEFVTTEGSCSGDSGGPIYTTGTKNVHGVVSRGTKSKVADGDTRPGAACVGGISIYTRVYDNIPIIQKALKDANEVIELSNGALCSSDECSKHVVPPPISTSKNLKKSSITCGISSGIKKSTSLNSTTFLLSCMLIIALLRKRQRQ